MSRLAVPDLFRTRRGLALAALSALVLAALVRVMVAPVSLPLAGIAERMLSERLGGAASVGRVTVQIGAGVLFVGLENVHARRDGLAVGVPRAVLRQGLSGRSVTVAGALMRLDPTREGAAPIPPAPAAGVKRLDAALARLVRGARAEGLTTLTLADGRLELVPRDKPVAAARVFQRIAVDIDLSDGLSAKVRAVGAEGPLALRLLAEGEGDGRTIRASVDGLVPADIRPLKPVREGFALDLDFTARIGADGEVDSAALDVGVGEGTVVFGIDPPRTLDGARLAFTLSPDGRRVRLEESAFRAGETLVKVTGTLVPGPGPFDPWAFALSAENPRFHPPDVAGPPVVVDRISAEGRIDPVGRLVHVDLFHGMMPEARARGAFTFDLSAAGPRLSGAAHVGASTIRALQTVWPPAIAHGPRQAVVSTVLGGILDRADIELALTPLELDGDPTTSDMIEGGMWVDLAFRDAALTVPELPVAVDRARGALRIKDKRLEARLESGRVEAGAGGALDVTEGMLVIPELGPGASAELTATVEGPLSAVVSLAERLDLPQLRATELKPDDVTGRVRADLRLSTPLGKDVTMSERRWAIDARLIDAGSTVPVGGRTFSDANVEVVLNARRIAARGRAVIDGLRVDVNYSELFAGEKSGAARFVLDEEERRERGFDAGSMLRGPVVVTVESDEDGARSFTADLTEAQVSLPVFSKPAGRSLVATGRMRDEDSGMRIEDLDVEGAGAALSGGIALAGGDLAWAAFDELALSDGDEARLNVENTARGYSVDVEASRFDARRLVRHLREGAGETADEGTQAAVMPPLAVRAEGERVRLTDDGFASDVSIDAYHTGERLERLALSGRLDDMDEGSFAARLSPVDGGARRLQADLTELGRALFALGIYERMVGGRTTLEARLDGEGVMRGRAVVRDFVLSEEKTLEAVIARSRRQAAPAADGRSPLPLAFQAPGAPGGLAFDELVIDFTRRGDEIRIEEAILRGPVMGGTAAGTVDLAEGRVTISGTFIPAYGVNNLFGRLPVFGQILGGGETGGLIGVTFRLAGPLEEPKLLLNPISAIAPGIFRRIFEFR